MKWRDRSDDNKASQLEVVDEFRSFVKPTWRPMLSDFCKNLTGITQVCFCYTWLCSLADHSCRLPLVGAS